MKRVGLIGQCARLGALAATLLVLALGFSPAAAARPIHRGASVVDGAARCSFGYPDPTLSGRRVRAEIPGGKPQARGGAESAGARRENGPNLKAPLPIAGRRQPIGRGDRPFATLYNTLKEPCRPAP